MAGSKSVAALLAASAATLALASACGADLNANTQRVVPPIPGINVDSGDHMVGLRDLQLVYPGPNGYPARAPAPLLVRLFNNDTKPLKLTCVKVVDASGTVGLIGGPPAPAATPTTVSTPSPPAVTASPSGSGASPSANARKPSAPPVTGSAVPSSPTPAAPPTSTGPASVPACGSGFSVTVAAFGYVLLTPDTGRYLAVSGLDRPLTVGDPWLNLSFTFDTGRGTVTLTAGQVPVGPPMSPLPRIPGNPSEAD